MLLTDLAFAHVAHSLATLLLQSPVAVNGAQLTWLTIFVGIIAVVILLVFLGVAIAGVQALKAIQSIQTEIAELRGKATPFITETHAFVTEMTPKVRAVVDDLQPKIKNISGKIDELVTDLTPKVKEIGTHAEHIAAVAREKVDEFGPTISSANQTVQDANETVQETNRKVRSQVTRVNGMVSATLDSVTRLGVAIEHGITRPGREVAGIVSGLKVGLDTLLSGARAFGSGAVGRTARPVPGNDAVNQPGGPARPAVVPYRSLAEQKVPQRDDLSSL